MSGIEFTEEEFLSFVKLIKMPECDEVRASDLETLSIAEWRTNLGCLNMVVPELNAHPIFQKISQYSPEDTLYLQNMRKRLESIFSTAFKRDLFIAIDAEQTYLQDAIRNVAEQFQQIHNGTGRYILNTYQAYLKSTYHHIQVELLKNQYIKKPLAIKLVRGAYLVEESALSTEGGYENPIHNSLEETHSCYDHSAESI